MRGRPTRWWGIAALVMMAGTFQVAAQGAPRADTAFQFRFGGFFPSGSSDFWSDNEEVFTLRVGDFDDFIFGMSFVRSVGNRLEVGFNGDYYASTTRSSYRGFVDSAGFPILHDTRLSEVPLTVDLRLVPFGRYRVRGDQGQYRVQKPVFYVGGGAGAVYWKYEEVGDFLDFNFDPPEIFFDRFIDDGWSFEYHALAGFELPLGHASSLLFEGRYSWAEETLGGDFGGLGTLDLGGLAVYVGGSWRF